MPSPYPFLAMCPSNSTRTWRSNLVHARMMVNGIFFFDGQTSFTIYDDVNKKTVSGSFSIWKLDLKSLLMASPAMKGQPSRQTLVDMGASTRDLGPARGGAVGKAQQAAPPETPKKGGEPQTQLASPPAKKAAHLSFGEEDVREASTKTLPGGGKTAFPLLLQSFGFLSSNPFISTLFSLEKLWMKRRGGEGENRQSVSACRFFLAALLPTFLHCTGLFCCHAPGPTLIANLPCSTP